MHAQSDYGTEMRVPTGPQGVIKRHRGCLIGAAEVPQIPDGIAAVPKASALCQQLPSRRDGYSIT
jgi:hypothetical protein